MMTKAMIKKQVRIGLLDSGIAPELESLVVNAAVCEAGVLHECPAAEVVDSLGHGALLSRIIYKACPHVEFVVARVFTRTLTTSIASAAVALQWLVEQRVDFINMSFGFREDNQHFKNCCQQAVDQGVVLLASNPSHGPSVYPASYQGVLAVTGDARCEPGQFAQLNNVRADIGACPYWSVEAQKQQHLGGSSLAVAQVVGKLAALGSEGSIKRSLARFFAECHYQGMEFISESQRYEKLAQLAKKEVIHT